MQVWQYGTQRGWSGDIGLMCNQSWAYSNIIVSDDGHNPPCTWLDRDHLNRVKAAAMPIHMQSFINPDRRLLHRPQLLLQLASHSRQKQHGPATERLETGQHYRHAERRIHEEISCHEQSRRWSSGCKPQHVEA